MRSNNYSVFVRNAQGGLIEFYDLSKIDALNLVKEMKEDGFTELDMVPTYTTPLFTDSLEAKEEDDRLE
ncbi:hypothetical protein EBT25_08740 [bacterium]|nr:hypothetical protein [bacterium]